MYSDVPHTRPITKEQRRAIIDAQKTVLRDMKELDKNVSRTNNIMDRLSVLRRDHNAYASIDIPNKRERTMLAHINTSIDTKSIDLDVVIADSLSRMDSIRKETDSYIQLMTDLSPLPSDLD
jgi:archaellum biogenesis ATPase FlaH